jgi:predicted phosphoadenosine phosphosulfate sulfurtransferase
VENAPGEHVRVQPLLDWREVDIWWYIQREKPGSLNSILREMESATDR